MHKKFRHSKKHHRGRPEGRPSHGKFEKKPRAEVTRLVGVIEIGGGKTWVRPTSRKIRDLFFLNPAAQIVAAKTGDVAVAEPLHENRIGQREARILENLGPFTAPRAVSLIAIAEGDIPFAFPENVVEASEKLKEAGLEGREDLRALPLVTIDGADARDFDDAVFAEADQDDPGGFHLIVAIADVSHYVKSGSVIDREAYKRGNSVYFPDRVVPMLPEALSNELCSLKPAVNRACLAVHMTIDTHGKLKRHRFTRGLMRSAARLTYEQAQAAADGRTDAITGPLLNNALKPLYAAYEVLSRARKARGTLDLDVAEREIKIDSHGQVASIGTRQRLESHKLVEEFMILANVAAATSLQERGMAGLYRIHDSPSAEKLENLRGFLKGFDIKLPQGQQLRPADLARVLEKFIGTDHAPVINEVMLRSQAQAVYSPENIGHFGLALARYAHFTSPIRRYADLIVHRALIRLFKLGEDGMSDDEMKHLEKIGEHISQTERRAIEAERSASDRYASLYLAEKTGEEFEGRISGVTRAGIFVRLNDTGADGLVPMRELPQDYYHFEESRHMLIGKRHGLRLSLANKVRVRLVEADPIVGGLRFALITSGGKRLAGQTGKPAPHAHRNRRRPRRRH